jgi:hypothetical protein
MQRIKPKDARVSPGRDAAIFPMKPRNLFAAVLLAAGLAVIPATSASAIGGGPNSLTVIAYYSDGSKQTLVGQKWSGCSGQDGQWGVATQYINLFFPAC